MREINLIEHEGRITLMYTIENSKRQDVIEDKYLKKLNCKKTNTSRGLKKTFYIEDDEKEKNVVILTFLKDSVLINLAIVEDDTFKMATVSSKIKYIQTKKEGKTEFYYTPTRQRKIFIIDVETGNEILPQLMLEETGEVRGKVMLEKNKKYLALELRRDGFKKIQAGFVRFNEQDEKYVLDIDEKEAKVVDISKLIEMIRQGQSIETKLNTKQDREHEK